MVWLGRRPVGESRRRRSGFTLTEMLLVGGLMSLLVILISGAWRGLARSSADAASRCRIAQEAGMAAASLARDFSGSLPEQSTGGKQCGQLVGQMILSGPELRLCYDGEPADGIADWGTPDTVVVYKLDTESRLVRQNVNAGSEFSAASKVAAMELTDQGDGVKIDLTFTYRDLTRTYTIVAKNP
jgi:type II secretory pathway pseudopilin PulG